MNKLQPSQTKILNKIASGASAFVMAIFGFSGFAAADAITASGPLSSNTISSDSTSTCEVNNNTNIRAQNNNSQDATTGDASTTDNTTAGNATTGDASNVNHTSASIAVNNSAAAAACACQTSTVLGSSDTAEPATINYSGPNSENNISETTTVTTEVTNNTNVSVTNNNSQDATTGDASTTDNTTAGNATTGDASNSNGTSFVASIVNGSAASAFVSHMAQQHANNNACGHDTNVVGPSAPLGTSNASITSIPTPNWVGGRGAGFVGSTSARAYFAATQPSYQRAPVASRVVPTTPAPAATQPTAPAQPASHSVSGPTISNTGPGSSNDITTAVRTTTTVTNNTNVSFASNNYQLATTGDASNAGNTTTIAAGSGNATNGAGTTDSAVVTN